MGRARRTGRPIPFDGEEPVGAARCCVHPGAPWRRADPGRRPPDRRGRAVGHRSPWSRAARWSGPRDLHATLAELRERDGGPPRGDATRPPPELGLRWLEVGVDPDTPLAEMPWMPKARYSIMRPYLGERGRLAHRMMTQTASIQVAFDYSDPDDWVRKFKTAALLTPVGGRAVRQLFTHRRRGDRPPFVPPGDLARNRPRPMRAAAVGLSAGIRPRDLARLRPGRADDLPPSGARPGAHRRRAVPDACSN